MGDANTQVAGPGQGVSGSVGAVGDDFTQFRVGDEVFAEQVGVVSLDRSW